MEADFAPQRISIVSWYNRCIQSFDQLGTKLLSEDREFFDQTTVSQAALQNELGRFKVWAGNSGAHRTGRVSLDYRLREALQVHGKVTDLLSDLNRALGEGTQGPIKKAQSTFTNKVQQSHLSRRKRSHGIRCPRPRLQILRIQLSATILRAHQMSKKSCHPPPSSNTPSRTSHTSLPVYSDSLLLCNSRRLVIGSGNMRPSMSLTMSSMFNTPWTNCHTHHVT